MWGEGHQIGLLLDLSGEKQWQKTPSRLTRGSISSDLEADIGMKTK